MMWDRAGRRIARSLESEFSLNTEEVAYLHRVRVASGRLGGAARRALMEEAAEALSERPGECSSHELEVSLGSPESWVVAYIDREQLTLSEGLPGWWQRNPRSTRLGLVVGFAVVLGVGWGGLRYLTATPHFFNPCGGIIATEFETFRAGGATEFRAKFRQDERIGVTLCPHTSTPGVTIKEVYRSDLVRMAFQSVGSEVDLLPQGHWIGDASQPVPWHSDDVPWLADVVLWYEMEFCNISGSIGFNTVEIDYRYRGRDRTTTIDLGYWVMVDAGDKCTNEVRAKSDRESEQWQLVVGDGITLGGPDGMVFNMEHENISRDLCRYLSGVKPALDAEGQPVYDQFEPLEARAVFQIANPEFAERLIDGAILGICPEHQDQRERLHSILQASQ